MHEPTRTEIDTVVLDVDGTLVDTVYHHVRAWDDAFAAVAGEVVEREHGDRVRAEHDASFEKVLDRVRALPSATIVYDDTADLLAHLDDIISPVTDA